MDDDKVLLVFVTFLMLFAWINPATIKAIGHHWNRRKLYWKEFTRKY